MTRWDVGKPHHVLEKFMGEWLGSQFPSRVLFPLCGSSLDLPHLARLGHDVVGVEGVAKAVDKLLAIWGEEKESHGRNEGPLLLRVGKASDEQLKASKEPTGLLRAVQGDFFELTQQRAAALGLGQAGLFDACFDRGSLVAVTPEDRPQYVRALTDLMAPGGKVLLVVVEHEPAFGPPHSISHEEVQRLFGRSFDVRLLQREDRLDIEPDWRQRGATTFHEVSYMLTKF